MPWAEVDEDSRIVLCVEDEHFDTLSEESKGRFTEYFDNGEIFEEIFPQQKDDIPNPFRVYGGKCHYEPTKEYQDSFNLRKEIDELTDNLPVSITEQDAAICALYETTLYEQQIIDSQDEALCALYEQMLGE